MNNLDKESFLTRAKELRDLINKNNIWLKKDKAPMVQSVFKTSNLISIFYAKQLKEKVEEGCEQRFWLNRLCYYANCGFINIDEDGGCKEYCKDCKETLKILNEILGEKE